MRHHPIRWLLPLAILAPALAQETLFSHSPVPNNATRVTAEALFSRPAAGGFLPVRVTVANKTGGDATLRFDTVANDSSHYRGDNGRLDSSFTIRSEAGKTSSHDLLVPVVSSVGASYYGSGANMRFNMSGSLGRITGTLSGNYAIDQPAILMSEMLHTPNASKLDSALRSKSSSHRGSTEFAGRFDPLRMPEDWRAYGGYDAMILTDDDWMKIAAPARHAILQWCRLGGRIEIRTLNASSTLESLAIGRSGSGGPAHGFGRIDLRTVAPSLELDPLTMLDRYSDKNTTVLNQSLRNDYSSSWPLYDSFGRRGFNYAIFVVVLIAFGILVGPVNLFVFAKSGMRHKLFITTPLISLATSALLVLLILLKDGLGGAGSRAALVEVRPGSGENSAYVLQEQVSRTGVLVGGSFTLDESAIVHPVPIPQSPWARLTASSQDGGRYKAVFDGGKLKLSGDWFQSRSEQGQVIEAVVPTRGRIERRPPSGPGASAPVLVSTFDFELDEVIYTDPDGGHWLATGLKSGQPMPASPLPAPAFRARLGEQAKRFGQHHRRLLEERIAEPGRFFATSGTGLLVETFEAIDWKGDHCLLTGPVVTP